MHKNKIIFVEGVPGTGKSTLAQFIAIQLEKNGFKTKWYHEALDDHFLNDLSIHLNNDNYSFKEGSDADTFIKTAIDLWKKAISKAEKEDKTLVVDAGLASMFLVLMFNDVPSETVKRAVKEFYPLFTSDSVVIQYYTNNENHSVDIWNDRAQWAKKSVIKQVEEIPFVKRKHLKGEDALIFEQSKIQEFMTELINSFSIKKLRIEISERNYSSYRTQVLDLLYLKNINYAYNEPELEKFCGIYQNQEEDLVVKMKDNELVCDWGHKDLGLIPYEKNIFNLRSYPIYLKFDSETDGKPHDLETFGDQVFRRAGCKFKRVEKSKFPELV